MHERFPPNVPHGQFIKHVRIAAREICHYQIIGPQVREHLSRNYAWLRDVVGTNRYFVSALLQYRGDDVIEFDFDIEKAELAKTALEAAVMAAPDDAASIQTPLSAAVDFATAGISADPLRDGIAQILSAVQEIKGMVHGAPSPTAWGRIGGDNRRVRDAVLERFSTKLRELGVSVQSMGMPVEVTGGITMHFGDHDVEVSIGRCRRSSGWHPKTR